MVATSAPSLAQLRQQVSRCTLCPQRLSARNRVVGMGTDRAEVMVIMPNPDREDDMQGMAGQGFNGSFLLQHLQRVGVAPSKVYVTNLVKCFPGFTRGQGFHDFHPEATTTCPTQHLFDEVVAVNPKLIVTVGPLVTRYFDIKGGINTVAGRIHETELGPVMPLVNPVSLNKKGPRDLVGFVTSLKLIKLFLEDGQAVPPAEGIVFMEPGTLIGMDIETEDWQEDQHKAWVWSVGVADEEFRYAVHHTELPASGGNDVGSIPVFHNAKFDMEYLERDGWEFEEGWHDTIIQAHLLGYGPLSLKNLTPVFTGYTLRDFKKVQKNKPLEENRDEALDYCSEDAWAALKLHQTFYPELERRGLVDLYEKEKRITPILRSMERKGIPIDLGRLEWLRGQLMDAIDRDRRLLEGSGQFTNIDDDREFARWFWKGREKEAPRTKSGKQLSASKLDLLKRHGEEGEEGSWPFVWCREDQYRLVRARLAMRRAQKFVATYLDHWAAGDGWIHPSFNQTGTVTWRFSCSSPNLQNVARIKESYFTLVEGKWVEETETIPLHQLFVAPKGWKFIAADYATLELRILANLAQDKVMQQAFLDEKDLHQMRVDSLADFWQAQGIHDAGRQRTLAKNVNYGIPYGLQGAGLGKRLDLSTEDAEALIDSFYADFPAVRPWQEAMLRHGHQYGYVKTFEGRPLYCPGIFAPWGKIKSRAENQCKNMPIQGGAAEIVKNAMVRCQDAIDREWPGQVFMVSQIHDELLFLAKDEVAQEVADFLETPFGMRDNRHTVPYIVEAKVGDTWGDLKQVEDPFADEDDTTDE